MLSVLTKWKSSTSWSTNAAGSATSASASARSSGARPGPPAVAATPSPPLTRLPSGPSSPLPAAPGGPCAAAAVSAVAALTCFLFASACSAVSRSCSALLTSFILNMRSARSHSSHLGHGHGHGQKKGCAHTRVTQRVATLIPHSSHPQTPATEPRRSRRTSFSSRGSDTGARPRRGHRLASRAF